MAPFRYICHVWQRLRKNFFIMKCVENFTLSYISYIMLCMNLVSGESLWKKRLHAWEQWHHYFVESFCVVRISDCVWSDDLQPSLALFEKKISTSNRACAVNFMFLQYQIEHNTYIHAYTYLHAYMCEWIYIPPRWMYMKLLTIFPVAA
jgi:hypothetical protein